MSAGSCTVYSPAVPFSRNQYGWLGGVSAGTVNQVIADGRLIFVQFASVP